MVNIFFTGVTGYVGGAILERLLQINKSNNTYQITALIRDTGKAKKLEALGVKTVIGDLESKEILIRESFNADVVLNIAHSDHLPSTKAIIEGLQKKIKETGKKGILIHTSGSGILTNDEAGHIYETTKIYDDADTLSLTSIPITAMHRDVDTLLFDESHSFSLFDLFIVAPTDIYGQHGTLDGITNPISIQVPGAIKAAIKKKQATAVGPGLNIWSNVHIDDLGDFYILLLEKAIKREFKSNADEQGYFLVENGEHQWKAIHEAIAQILVKKGVITNTTIAEVTTEEEIVDAYGAAFFKYAVGTNSRAKATKARRLGWKPKHSDIFATIEADVDYLLAKK